MYGKHLVASAYGWTPYVVVDDDFNVQGGVAVEMFRAAASYYNFDYDLKYDAGWFSFFENGTIGGSFASVIQPLNNMIFYLNVYHYIYGMYIGDIWDSRCIPRAGFHCPVLVWRNVKDNLFSGFCLYGDET